MPPRCGSSGGWSAGGHAEHSQSTRRALAEPIPRLGLSGLFFSGISRPLGSGWGARGTHSLIQVFSLLKERSCRIREKKAEERMEMKSDVVIRSLITEKSGCLRPVCLGFGRGSQETKPSEGRVGKAAAPRFESNKTPPPPKKKKYYLYTDR